MLRASTRKSVDVSKLDQEMMARKVAIQNQLIRREREMKNNCLIHPSESTLLPWWDLTTMIALVTTALVTPWETAFVEIDSAVDPWREGWFLLNRMIDIIFLADMVLQFFIMYPLEQKTATSQIVYVSSPRKIARHYLLGWFLLDFLTMVPSVIGAWSYRRAFREGVSGEGVTSNITILRVLRAVRMIKLVRLLRASKIYERWQSRVSLTHAQMAVLKCVVGVILMAHWFACITALEISLHVNPADTWLSVFGYCDDPAGTCRDVDVATRYFALFSWALLLITGCGPGEYPNPSSIGETLVVAFMQFLAALFWTVILATFCDVRHTIPAALPSDHGPAAMSRCPPFCLASLLTCTGAS